MYELIRDVTSDPDVFWTAVALLVFGTPVLTVAVVVDTGIDLAGFKRSAPARVLTMLVLCAGLGLGVNAWWDDQQADNRSSSSSVVQPAPQPPPAQGAATPIP